MRTSRTFNYNEVRTLDGRTLYVDCGVDHRSHAESRKWDSYYKWLHRDNPYLMAEYLSSDYRQDLLWNS